jgi:hypothetical protein
VSAWLKLFPERSVREKSHPIRLADVLLAISEKRIKEEKTSDYLYDAAKMLLGGSYADKLTLHAGDLEKQSEDTVNFLYELLKSFRIRASAHITKFCAPSTQGRSKCLSL